MFRLRPWDRGRLAAHSGGPWWTNREKRGGGRSAVCQPNVWSYLFDKMAVEAVREKNGGMEDLIICHLSSIKIAIRRYKWFGTKIWEYILNIFTLNSIPQRCV